MGWVDFDRLFSGGHSEQGLELIRESGEPMEFGIYDFCKVFQGLLVRGEWGSGDLEWKVGDVVTDPGYR